MADESRDIRAYIHKTVPFRFAGSNLEFGLSHSVFSSYDVDAGSKLLLKTIAQHASAPQGARIWDLGCGAGVLAVSLGKRYDGSAVYASDRNVFAVALTEANAHHNHVAVTATASIGFEDPPEPVDVLVSNVPAKAGEPVLRDFVVRVGDYLRPGGRACLVFVSPLRDLVDHAIGGAHLSVLYREETNSHFVVHLGPTEGTSSREKRGGDELLPYIRTSGQATFAGFQYSAETVYGLPEFDTLSFRSEVLLDVALRSPRTDVLRCINPGQGHLVTAIARKRHLPRAWIASDDVLQLRCAARNLEANDVAATTIEIAHLGDLGSQECPRDGGVAVVSYDPPAASDWIPDGLAMTRSFTSGGGLLLFGSSSTVCHRFEKALVGAGYTITASRKYRGQRVLTVCR